VVLKGYENFPKSFIKNYLNIDSKTTFNKKKLMEISKLSKGLDFVSETKPPETLFTKDSTFIYVYLKKIQGSSFDGLVNFISQENGELQFNGYLDLKLKNVFHKGEQLNLLWNRFGNEKQELSIAVKIPYIYNSKLSPAFAFSIYKQDSTFLNTHLNAHLKYQIKNNSNLFVSFNSEKSENSTKTISNNISTYENYFLGVGYEYKILKNDIFRNELFSININPSFGKRKTIDNTTKQIKIATTIAYLLDLNRKNSVYFRNKAALLNSTNYLDNELFRIGGNKSIRGFNEQSIFVKNYLAQNIEFRYQASKNSYLYTITDLALISTTNRKEKLYSLGLGYLFHSNNSQINIATAVGTNTKNTLDFKNTQFFVNWVNFF
jgi:hemolysin activation/secretion protein